MSSPRPGVAALGLGVQLREVRVGLLAVAAPGGEQARVVKDVLTPVGELGAGAGEGHQGPEPRGLVALERGPVDRHVPPHAVELGFDAQLADPAAEQVGDQGVSGLVPGLVGGVHGPEASAPGRRGDSRIGPLTPRA